MRVWAPGRAGRWGRAGVRWARLLVAGRPDPGVRVFYGHDRVPGSGASALAAQADVLLCVGSSLEVYPVAQLPQITLAAGGAVALVTKGPTPYDGDAAVKLDGDVVEELGAVVEALPGR